MPAKPSIRVFYGTYGKFHIVFTIYVYTFKKADAKILTDYQIIPGLYVFLHYPDREDYMKRAAGVVLALLIAGGAGAGAYYQFIFKNNQNAAGGRVSSQSEDAVYVDSVSMIAGLESGTGLIARYAGIVEPQETWSAKLENEKTVKKTYVKEGDSVKEGDKLFTYDTSEDEDKLAQDQIDLERLQNDIISSKARLEQLNKEKAKAKQDDQLTYTTQILSEENAIKQDEYEIKTKELEISQVKEAIARADVTSELEGVVQSINNPNSSSSSMMSGESDEYITIMAVGDYRVKGTVNEQNIGDLYEGQAMLAFSRVDDLFWSGTVSEIKRDNGKSNANDSYGESSDSSTSSTNYPFYVELDSSEGLMLGQHVYLEPDEGQKNKKDGIWIPDYYLFDLTDGSSASVWAASESNSLQIRALELGQYDENTGTYEITSGLDKDDYITTPADFLEEGLPVIYMDDVQSAGGAGYDVYGDGMEYEDGSLMYDSEELYFDEDFINGDETEDEDADEVYYADEDEFGSSYDMDDEEG